MINNVHEAFQEAEQFLTRMQKNALPGTVRLLGGLQADASSWLLIRSFSPVEETTKTKRATIFVDRQSHQVTGYMEVQP